jgi:hypothetical protein
MVTTMRDVRCELSAVDPTKSGRNLFRGLFVLVLFVRLVGDAPFVAIPIAQTLRPKVSRQTAYTRVQFFGQRWHLVVGYQGSEKIFDYNPDWTVKVIRERAILAFRLAQCQPPLPYLIFWVWNSRIRCRLTLRESTLAITWC